MSHSLSKLILHLKNTLTTGQVHLILPDQQMRTFTGKKKGPTVTWLIHDLTFVDLLVKDGSTSLPGAYARGLWTASNLVDFMFICFQNSTFLQFSTKKNSWIAWLIKQLRTEMHSYDFVFDQFIDHCCAEQMGQYRKLLSMQSKMRILDMGCDGGGFAKFAARNNHEVTVLTLSKTNYQKAKDVLKKDLELSRVRLLYNAAPAKQSTMNERYDLITSMGLFENLRLINLQNVFQTIKNNLSLTGFAAIQTLFVPNEKDNYLSKYLFQNHMIPNLNHFKREAAKEGLELTQVETTGGAYLEHLEKMYVMIKEHAMSEKPVDLLKSLEYCCANIIAALKTGNASIAQIQLQHAVAKNNVVQLAI
ncbi:MAG: class I SAM-dependent methyltransferase [Pseudomonadota bacterium]